MTIKAKNQKKINKAIIKIPKASGGMASAEELEKLINPGGFESSIVIPVKKFTKYGDSIYSEVMSIYVYDIDESKFNPRKANNNHFQEIKQSIKDIGLQQLFSVSRNPKTKQYTLIKGGNTRLRAYKELWRETGETKYENIECVVEPWSDELNKTQVVISHLIENEARGDLTLVDKAKALYGTVENKKHQNLAKIC
jgi:ParB family protein of integrating conjugative element (PFGI_1 class)